ncbi:MAG TPA: SRPBCC family protein [Acidimicrobiales bacterium]|nr:SRPBCC family protein [Acidimicrobiales bacterium]
MTGTAADPPVDTASVTVAADPATLWDMVSDVTRMGEWSPECTSCRWLGGRTTPEVGARFVGFNRRRWARWATTNEVIESRRGSVFAFRTRQTGVVWGYRFAPDGDGGTVVTETRDLTAARSWLVRLAGPFVGGADAHSGELREGMHRTLERLKATAEGPAPG